MNVKTWGSALAIAALLVSACSEDNNENNVCGNGIQEENEACDDGNLNNNDGCNQNCQIESNTNTSVCGNGIQEENEACDDGNQVDNDECSNTCQVNTAQNTGYTPNPGPQTQCGDGKLEAGEICEIGLTAEIDGVSRKCIKNADGKCVYETIEGKNNCGNGTVEEDEACDDGNKINRGDNCSNKCQIADSCKLQNGSSATVLLAADGDTLKLKIHKDSSCTTESIVTVRMHGIDCPECLKTKTVSPVDPTYNEANACDPTQATNYENKEKNEKGGYEAWMFVNELLASVNYQVKVGCETISSDSSVCLADASLARFLAYIGIEKDGQSLDLAREIIAAGFGMAYTDFTSQRIELYCDAEKTAVSNKEGIWNYADSFENVVKENFNSDKNRWLLSENHCKE